MHLGISVNIVVMVKATCDILIYFLETQSTSSLTYFLRSSSGNYNFLIIKYFQNMNRIWIDNMISYCVSWCGYGVFQKRLVRALFGFLVV